MRFVQRGFLVMVLLLISTMSVLAQDVGAGDTLDGETRDGKHILFSSTRQGHHDLYMMDADGSNVRQLITGQSIYDVQVAPDGTRLAILQYTGSEYDVYVFN